MNSLTVRARGPGWLVIDKPSGLLSAPGRHEPDSVISRLENAGVSARVVHRLDMDTSGLLVVATDSDVHRALSAQFKTRSVRKSYVARLSRPVAADEGLIVLAFRLDTADRPRQVFDPVHGKLGVTRFRVLARNAHECRVRFWPVTGRTHQLRLHAAHPVGLSAPIIGDSLYGRPLGGVERLTAGRLALDADQLSFECPRSGQRRHFRRPSRV